MRGAYQCNMIDKHVFLNPERQFGRFLQYKTRGHHYVLFTESTLSLAGRVADPGGTDQDPDPTLEQTGSGSVVTEC